jgi:hypothetical protein
MSLSHEVIANVWIVGRTSGEDWEFHCRIRTFNDNAYLLPLLNCRPEIKFPCQICSRLSMKEPVAVRNLQNCQ